MNTGEFNYLLRTIRKVQYFLGRSIRAQDRENFLQYVRILKDDEDYEKTVKYMSDAVYEAVLVGNDDPFFVQTLVEAGASASLARNGETPLKLAEDLGLDNIVAYLRTRVGVYVPPAPMAYLNPETRVMTPYNGELRGGKKPKAKKMTARK